MVLGHQNQMPVLVLSIQVQVPPLGLLLEPFQDEHGPLDPASRTRPTMFEQPESRRGDRELYGPKGLMRGTFLDPSKDVTRRPDFQDYHRMFSH